MKLKFLGKGSSFVPPLCTTSAYFVEKDKFFLIDCGEHVFGKIWTKEELKKCPNIYVIITHLHTDHVGSLGSFISYCYFVLHKIIHIVHPINTILSYLDLCGIKREYYFYHRELPAMSTGTSIRAVEVDHVDNMKCFGYIITIDREKIYYSGDAANIPNVILKQFLSKQISFLCQDTMAADKDGKVSHCTLKNLEQLIPLADRSRVYCMHLDTIDESLFTNKGFHIIPVEE